MLTQELLDQWYDAIEVLLLEVREASLEGASGLDDLEAALANALDEVEHYELPPEPDPDPEPPPVPELPTHIILNPETDRIPVVARNPTHTAIKSGSWDDPATWDAGSVPAEGSHVHIPPGVAVEADTWLDCRFLLIRGTLRMMDKSAATLHTCLVWGGELLMGTPEEPIYCSWTFKIPDGEIREEDPLEHLGGLLVVDGKLRVYGHPKTPFVRMTDNIGGGVEPAPVNWEHTDFCVIPDTRQFPRGKDQSPFQPTPFVSDIDAIGDSHVRLREQPAPWLGPSGQLPHIANLSRSIEFMVAGNGKRAITQFFRRADVTLHYCGFSNMGRTDGTTFLDTSIVDPDTGQLLYQGSNHIARYPIHFHHVIGPEGGRAPESEYQFEVVGCALLNSRRWPITVHSSHYGLIKDNVIYDFEAAGIMFEHIERSNVCEGNFICLGRGTGDNTGVTKFKHAFTGRRVVDIGIDGAGIWSRRSGNVIRDNVITNVVGWGINYNGYLSGFEEPEFKYPSFPGQSPENYLEFAALPMIHHDNEVYASRGAFWATWHNGVGSERDYQRNVISGERYWHLMETGIEVYHEGSLTFEDLIIENDPAISATSGQNKDLKKRTVIGINMQGSSYMNFNHNLRNVKVTGFNLGIAFGHRDTDSQHEDLQLANYVDVVFKVADYDKTKAQDLPIRHHLDGVLFAEYHGPDVIEGPAQPAERTHVLMLFDPSAREHDFEREHQFWIDGRRYYFFEQHPDYTIDGVPNHARTKPLYGRIAPCLVVEDRVLGFVCDI